MSWRKIWILTIMFILLSGCGRVKEIHNQAYAVGMGIDYVDNEYHVVIQFLDFSNVAKTDQGKSSDQVPVWITKGKGKTIETALSGIYQTIQMRVNFEQLNLIIFGEGLITSKQLYEAFQSLTSNFTVRLTAWTYGTQEKFDDIFTSSVIFDYPFSYSRLNQPNEGNQQSSTIPAITLRDFVWRLNEKTITTIVPSVSLNEQHIFKESKPIKAAVINGAYILNDKTYKGWLSTSDLRGFIWTNDESIRSITTIKEDKDHLVEVELIEPEIKLKKKKDELSYNINVNLRAMIRESLDSDMAQEKIKKKVEVKVKEEVKKAFNAGKELGADIFQLEDNLYRYYNNEWLNNKHENPIELANIKVNVIPLYSIDKFKSKKQDANTKREN
ncbi:Ger(x)C family spore germination protein [Metabacillus bambusae]|uniref:Ger(X)C family spore germination protein n=1 Tax=Metabacillus bambusae TaxID=2795218 RepID=A0ABS3N8R2_9BACI|nr:Ger(x)C family spore germination protein [Metabacillus bambusae]MBO1514680.1 Ger(x)C family spore germination protein [Metabacillus bambusae]